MKFVNEDSVILYDEISSPPVFNYARIFSWSKCVDEVTEAYEAAAEQAEDKHPVASGTDWKDSEDASIHIHSDNRKGRQDQVVAYCTPTQSKAWRSKWGSSAFFRIAQASVAALCLQWGTAGAAVVVVWFTPTTGLGCRSGAYLLYAVVSTIVWFMMVASSIIAHYSTISNPSGNTIPLQFITFPRHTDPGHLRRASTLPLVEPFKPYDPYEHYDHNDPPTHIENSSTANADKHSHHYFQRSAASFAIILNAAGKLLAILNALWIICACMFQFTNVFNRCICNSSVYGRGSEFAYNVLKLTDGDEGAVKSAWIGGVALGLITVGLFVGFIGIYRRPKA